MTTPDWTALHKGRPRLKTADEYRTGLEETLRTANSEELLAMLLSITEMVDRFLHGHATLFDLADVSCGVGPDIFDGGRRVEFG